MVPWFGWQGQPARPPLVPVEERELRHLAEIARDSPARANILGLFASLNKAQAAFAAIGGDIHPDRIAIRGMTFAKRATEMVCGFSGDADLACLQLGHVDLEMGGFGYITDHHVLIQGERYVTYAPQMGFPKLGPVVLFAYVSRQRRCFHIVTSANGAIEPGNPTVIEGDIETARWLLDGLTGGARSNF
jgi:hypothetical protein